jgi:hypothetical protein
MRNMLPMVERSVNKGSRTPSLRSAQPGAPALRQWLCKQGPLARGPQPTCRWHARDRVQQIRYRRGRLAARKSRPFRSLFPRAP